MKLNFLFVTLFIFVTGFISLTSKFENRTIGNIVGISSISAAFFVLLCIIRILSFGYGSNTGLFGCYTVNIDNEN